MKWVAEKGSFRANNVTREYFYVEGHLKALVVVLSGRGVSQKDMMQRFAPLHECGFPVVYPQASHNLTWNIGSFHGEEYEFGAFDAEFVGALSRYCSQLRNISLVYLTGTSNGAFMASILSLRAVASSVSSWFHAVALVSGFSFQRAAYFPNQTSPSFALLALHSKMDESVSFEGHSKRAECGESCVSFPEARERWMNLQGCNEATIFTRVNHVRSHVCYSGVNCTFLTVFCEFRSVRHNFPGAGSVVSDFFLTQYWRSMNATVSSPELVPLTISSFPILRNSTVPTVDETFKRIEGFGSVLTGLCLTIVVVLVFVIKRKTVGGRRR